MSDGRQPGAFRGIELILAEDAEGWTEWLGQDPELLARRAVVATLERAGMPAELQSELGITLTDDASVKALNAEWRGKDKPTNILSFPTRAIGVGERPGPLMGDLVLALETCEREAAAEGKTPADHATHLLVHGILHLLGHDHLGDEEAERMEKLEILILSDLSIADPYGDAETTEDNAGGTRERNPLERRL